MGFTILDVLGQHACLWRPGPGIHEIPGDGDQDKAHRQGDFDSVHEGDESQRGDGSNDRRDRIQRDPKVGIVVRNVRRSEDDQSDVQQRVDDEVEDARRLGEDFDVPAK